VQRSLPEMNQAKKDHQLNFQIFAFHRGGEKPQAVKIINGKDARGKDWALDFVWSSSAFEKQLGGVVGLPSYYVIDSQARVRGVVKGHSKDTLATLKWLVDEISKPHSETSPRPKG
jgi:hypothetical protein